MGLMVALCVYIAATLLFANVSISATVPSLSYKKGYVDASVYVYESDTDGARLVHAFTVPDNQLTPGSDVSVNTGEILYKSANKSFIRVCIARTPSAKQDGITKEVQQALDSCGEFKKSNDSVAATCGSQVMYGSLTGALLHAALPGTSIHADVSCAADGSPLAYAVTNRSSDTNINLLDKITSGADISSESFSASGSILQESRVSEKPQRLAYDADSQTLSISSGNAVALSFELPNDSVVSDAVNQEDDRFNAKENVLTFDSGLTRTDDTVSLMDCAADQHISKDETGASWVCIDRQLDTDTTYTSGAGIALTGTTFALEGTDISPGLYNSLVVDEYGRVTEGANITYLQEEVDGITGNEVAGVINGGGLIMSGEGTDVDPYKLGLVSTCSDAGVLKYANSTGWSCGEDINTDSQALTYNTATNQLDLSNGGTVDLSLLLDNTDEQQLRMVDNELQLTNSNSVNLEQYLDNTDNQSLSWDALGRQLTLVNGGTISIDDADTTYSAGNGLRMSGTVISLDAPTCDLASKLQWQGDQFICVEDLDTGSGPQVLAYDPLTNTLQIAGGNTVVFPYASQLVSGVLSSEDWTRFDGKENVLTLDGKGMFSRVGDTIVAKSCNSVGQVLQWAGSSWVCGTISGGGITSVRSFVDTIPDPVTDSDTTDYWDAGLENNMTKPNITLSTVGNQIMGTVSMEMVSKGNGDAEVAARIVRGIGYQPTCATGTAVGGGLGVFSSNKGGKMTGTVNFIDDVSSILPVYYTVCSDAATVGASGDITRIRVTLQEVTNTN